MSIETISGNFPLILGVLIALFVSYKIGYLMGFKDGGRFIMEKLKKDSKHC